MNRHWASIKAVESNLLPVVIGAMGMSGDAFLVHLHYQLQSGAKFEEGLPAYFANVRVKTGAGWSPRFTGPVDSGDVAETVAK